MDMDQEPRRPEEFGLTWKTLFDDPEKSAGYWAQFPLDEFVAMTVNEARTHLGVIDNSLRLIVDEAKAGSIVVEDQMAKVNMIEWLESLIRSGERLNNVLTVMVDYSKQFGKPSGK